MRFWSRRVDPNTPFIHKRSRVGVGEVQFSSLKQKPLFGRSDEEGDTSVESVMPPELRLKNLTPTDKSAGNSNEAQPQFVPATLVTYVSFNADATPTEANFDDAFGLNNKNEGFVGILSDGTLTSYMVISNGFHWFFHKLTRAT